MKIRVSDISEDGKKLEGKQEDHWVRQGLETDSNDVFLPNGALYFDLRLVRAVRKVELRGTSSLKWITRCGRCLKDLDYVTEITLKEAFLPSEEFRIPTDKEVDLEEEDFINSFYHDDEIDLGRYLLEQHLLALPMVLNCPEECSLPEIENQTDIAPSRRRHEGVQSEMERRIEKTKRRMVKKIVAIFPILL